MVEPKSVNRSSPTATAKPLKKYGITTPISLTGPNEADRTRNEDLEKLLVKSGLYESKDEAVKREGVLARIDQEKMNFEDKYHLYISEVELQMHQPSAPFWAKPEYYFQSMSKERMRADQDDAFQGEIEIERIQTRMVEARSKYFIPVFDFVQGPRLQQANQRILTVDSNTNGRLRDQRPELSENGFFSRMSSSGSLDSMLAGSAADAEPLNGRSQMPIEANTREYKHESSEIKDQLQFVNNSNEGLNSENHSEDGDDLFH